jgi:hypothetical protein
MKRGNFLTKICAVQVNLYYVVFVIKFVIIAKWGILNQLIYFAEIFKIVTIS